MSLLARSKSRVCAASSKYCRTSLQVARDAGLGSNMRSTMARSCGPAGPSMRRTWGLSMEKSGAVTIATTSSCPTRPSGTQERSMSNRNKMTPKGRMSREGGPRACPTSAPRGCQLLPTRPPALQLPPESHSTALQLRGLAQSPMINTLRGTKASKSSTPICSMSRTARMTSTKMARRVCRLTSLKLFANTRSSMLPEASSSMTNTSCPAAIRSVSACL
mmetsp:Transcript_112047/g.322038  ORF Transcript_112047/g.322038 Transcript_112047/m.322038 type:complete len:219 (-) Transcript_112047:2220-2876(-)